MGGGLAGGGLAGEGLAGGALGGCGMTAGGRLGQLHAWIRGPRKTRASIITDESGANPASGSGRVRDHQRGDAVLEALAPMVRGSSTWGLFANPRLGHRT